MKEPNKEAPTRVGATAEAPEGRPPTKGNREQPALAAAQDAAERLTGLAAIRRAAERDRGIRFTSLLHHLTGGLLLQAHEDLNRSAASGVDEVTWREYGEELGSRLPDLLRRVHEGTYRAQPSKRIYIPKPDGRKRPIGIASIEDKIVQQALVMILNEIYEVDFLGFSYGFRPGRNPHRALDAVWMGIMRRKVEWILDADIKGFFDNLNHQVLMSFLERRIADKRVLRLIQKWLRAGVSEDGEWSRTEVGTPQGAASSYFPI